MFEPRYPGETLKVDVLPALGLTISAAAHQLGVSRSSLSRILNGRSSISPQMALRLEQWLGVEHGGRADLWLAEQVSYNLWQARQSFNNKVAKAPIR